MVATSTQVYVLKELDSFSTGDAAHEKARGATLVHLSIEQDDGLGATSYTPCLGLIWGQSFRVATTGKISASPFVFSRGGILGV